MARSSFVGRHPSQTSRGIVRLLALTCLLGSQLATIPAALATSSSNLHVGKTVGTATLSPRLSVTLGVDKTDAIPRDRLTYSAVVTNTGAILTVSGDLAVQNTLATAATVADFFDVVSTASIAHCGVDLTDEGKDLKHWPPSAGYAAALPGYLPVRPAPMAAGLRLAATPVPAGGVSYPSSGDRILGTQIDPGVTARWHYTASVPLSTTQVAFLLDPASVGRIRNTFHAEPTPRDQNGDGSPATINTDFCDQFYAQPPTGAADNVSVAFTLPDGSTATVDRTGEPDLAAIDPGASVTATTRYTVPVPAAKGDTESDAAYLTRLTGVDGATLSAQATASAPSPTGPVTASAGPVTTTEHLPILSIAKTGPAGVDAGDTAHYDIPLRNTGSAPASHLAVEDSVPAGSNAIVNGVPSGLDPGASTTAHASYAVPATQPAGDLTDTATLSWRDANDNPYGPISATATTKVRQTHTAANLALAPPAAGPLPLGSTHTFRITATNAAGDPVANLAVHLVVDGPNATSADLTTATDGTAAFSYIGTSPGTDTAQATAGALISNTASVAWLTPAQPITTTTIHGKFFPNPSNSGAFTATPATPPSFELDFPTIDFNPPAGTVRGASSSVNNRPFVDIDTDLGGNFAGSIVAEGNGLQAGVSSLTTFDAEFTGSYTVAAAGDITFDFYSDDGFILGIGGGATRVSGALQNPPASGVTAFLGYPVVGSYNNPTSPVANQVTVHFPGPGTYPYELDYSECCGGQLVLTMTNHASGRGVPPTGSLTISPTNFASKPVGQSQTITVAAMDASGAPVANLPVEFTVTGPNEAQGEATTDAAGLATFSLTGTAPGSDQVQASALISELPAISNIVFVPWTGVALAPPTIGSPSPADGTVVTAPLPVKATFTPPLVRRSRHGA